MLTLLLFLYGLASGFVLMRLERKRRRARTEWRILNAAGWALAALSLSLAALLLAWALLRSLGVAGEG